MSRMHVSDLPDRSQDYLKKIYDLQEWGSAGASLTDLARELGQRPSTASEAVKRLVSLGLVVHAPYGDITLSDDGRRLALMMVRRHRLLETYLLRELGYAVDEVHDEAEVLEHAVSDLFIERIDAAMGRPARDPHGDPIPDADGVVTAPSVVPLTDAATGDRLVVDRVSDRDPALLRYLQQQGILPGAVIEVLERPYPDMAQLRIIGSGERAGDGAAAGDGGGVAGGSDATRPLTVQLSVASLDAVLCRENGPA